ncbi:MAG TPA: sigma 54-interacting transcriptional regulator [Kofleriaceae bacterium]|nr:sigma 54-interacting transcriptional regulator [Kofleriaceae bacterium]
MMKDPMDGKLTDDPDRTDTLTSARVVDHALVQQARLRVMEGPDAGRVYASRSERSVIGTHESADLVLGDPTVSRFHCEIMIGEGAPVIRDLGSRNGTQVGDTSVLVGHLRDGSMLVLGRTRLRFELTSDHIKVPVSDREQFGSMRGVSRDMRIVFAQLERAARSDVTVLLTGETGTGKDVAAESIHRESARAGQPFMVVDCGSIPGPLLESELFGHERGAFTGADRARPGAFEAADGGTLFLDEIGELGLELQPKLLRVLEDRSIQRIGTTGRTQVDVRLVAATNRNLRTEVNAHRFRSDLYYRLAVMEVTLPPLRERPQDIPGLVAALLEGMDADPSVIAPLMSGELMGALGRHSWPGNVRELRNYLERCVAMEQPMPLATADDDAQPAVDVRQPYKEARDRWLRHFERRYLEEQLRLHGNNVSAVARASRVDRIHLYRMLSRCGLR